MKMCSGVSIGKTTVARVSVGANLFVYSFREKYKHHVLEEKFLSIMSLEFYTQEPQVSNKKKTNCLCTNRD